MKKPKINLIFDHVTLKFFVLLILIFALIFSTRRKSLEEQYPNKKVLRVSFYIYLPEMAKVWNEIKTEFEQKHPDVKIIWVEDIRKKLSILEAAKMLPDILSPNTFYLYRFRNSLLPLDEFIERDKDEIKPDDFYPQIMDLCRYENKQLTIPYMFNVSLLYYNIDMFKESGVPVPNKNWTYENYVSAAQKLAKFDKDGNQIQWGTAVVPQWWIEWLSHVHKAGGRFISDDWQSSPMDSPEAIAGLKFFNDIVNKYKISPEPRNLDNYPFLNQQTAMEFAGHLDNWIGLRANANFKWDVTTLPQSPRRMNGGERVAVGMGINKNCKHKELAMEFIKFISSYESRVKFIQAGMIPVRQSVARDVFFKRGKDSRYIVGPQHKEILYEALERCREQCQIPEFEQLAQNQALPLIYSMLRQEITPEQCGKQISITVTNFLKMINRKNPLYDYKKGCLKVPEDK